MFFHKKLGWLTPNVVSSPVDSCLSPFMPSCSGGSPCLGSRTPPIHKVLRMAGLKPPGHLSVTGEGLSSPAPQGIPIVLMSCSPRGADFDPWNRSESAIWKERNIFTKELPRLSGVSSPLPTPGPPSLWAPPCQPDCIAPLCLMSFPMCHDPCGSMCVAPINLFPCNMQFPLASNCARMTPCAGKISTPGPCATKGENLCNREPSLASKCASPLSCTMTSPYTAKYANGVLCAVEILPASSCVSPVSCAAEIQCEAKGATFTSPCGTKGASFHPCDVDILPSPNCTSPVSCATKGVTTIPYATKGATAPCACATKCVSAIPTLPQCACPAPCGTKGAVEVLSTPSWPVLNSCTPNSCYKAPAFTVPQVAMKWAGKCGVSCPNIGTLSVSQTCPPLNTTFAKK